MKLAILPAPLLSLFYRKKKIELYGDVSRVVFIVFKVDYFWRLADYT